MAGVGTGGTITGTARYLKEQKPDMLVVGADPEGSLYSGDVHPYLTEGIGEDFWPATFDPSLVDRYVRVSDRDAFRMARRITREEGILVGGSSGTAVVAALEVARELGRVRRRRRAPARHRPQLPVEALLRHVAAPVRADRAPRGRAGRGGPAGRHGEVPPLVTVNAHDKVRQAIDVLQEYSISQAPVVRETSMDVAQFVGSIRESALLDRIFRDPDALQADVAEVMGPPISMVEFDEPVEVAFEALQHGPAVLVVKAGQALGVLTRSDLLEFLAHRSRP